MRFILVSERLMADVTRTWAWENSKQVLLDGLDQVLDSPADYLFFYEKQNHPGVEGWPDDLFDLEDHDLIAEPRRASSRTGPTDDPRSLDHFVYPLALVVLLLFWRRVPTMEQGLVLFAVGQTLLFAFLDYRESNRMRFEIEPLWYLMCIRAVALLGGGVGSAWRGVQELMAHAPAGSLFSITLDAQKGK